MSRLQAASPIRLRERDFWELLPGCLSKQFLLLQQESRWTYQLSVHSTWQFHAPRNKNLTSRSTSTPTLTESVTYCQTTQKTTQSIILQAPHPQWRDDSNWKGRRWETQYLEFAFQFRQNGGWDETPHSSTINTQNGDPLAHSAPGRLGHESSHHCSKLWEPKPTSVSER